MKIIVPRTTTQTHTHTNYLKKNLFVQHIIQMFRIFDILVCTSICPFLRALCVHMYEYIYVRTVGRTA